MFRRPTSTSSSSRNTKKTLLASTLLALTTLSTAAQIPVKVGSGGLNFSPNDVQAQVGDELVFTFYPKDHSVTQSSFAAPCQQLAGGFNSGLVPVASGTGGTFTVAVNSTDPIWIYCAQNMGQHCQKGMVMAVNAPSSGNTLAAYQAASAKTSNSTIGSAVTGGVLATNGTSTSGGNGTVSTGSPSSASATSGMSSPAPSTAAAAGGLAAEWLVMGGAAVLGGLLV